ncbi:4Fe-4S binding domain-containing protein [Caloramator fervidus]|uniref:4Fe-4S binding domain-containing protein n=1 Tax=Caloramator fervidus TaxID=29344 RepID=A0A1H5SNV4_9CLOT|nr:4Fe-4S binding protein [Caloramator fervidus]SEF52249.1 4Fe-4S binding domain-containing protein [Caloramator fervidus]
MQKRTNHQSWSWIILASFIILGYFYRILGLFGIICMTMPLYHALRGRGKIHCSHYCPRGSLLGKFLKHISFNNTLPNFMRSKTFKNILLILMISLLSLALSHSHGHIPKIAFAIYRFMSLSLLVGIIIGIIFKPRSWCQICPMGHACDLIDKNLIKKEGTN